jgi:hypothetical protein
MPDDTYKVDPDREDATETGIFVRAQFNNRFESVDIATLDVHSLKLWLRSRGGVNDYAERVIAMILGHDPDDITREWPY